VGPALSYQFALSYNSNVWDQTSKACGIESYVIAEPDEQANAGLGWQLHLGRLFPPVGTAAGGSPEATQWSYNSADGGRHAFYDSLHQTNTATFPPVGSQPNTWFTKDGTYLRMRLFGAGNGCDGAVEAGASTACRRIEFPNGNLHEFRNYTTSGDDWRLTHLRDRYGNNVNVTYPSAATWRFEDSHGRIHRIFFDLPAGRPARVRELRVRQFAAGATAAVYRFTYDEGALVDREQFDLNQALPLCATEPQTEIVDVLTRVEQPDGSFWNMEIWDGMSGEIYSGGLKKLRLPTSGVFEYDYTAILYQSQDPSSGLGVNLNRNYGVREKRIFDSDTATTPLGAWTYLNQADLSDSVRAIKVARACRRSPAIAR
jgi:hypothetical protein